MTNYVYVCTLGEIKIMYALRLLVPLSLLRDLFKIICQNEYFITEHSLTERNSNCYCFKLFIYFLFLILKIDSMFLLIPLNMTTRADYTLELIKSQTLYSHIFYEKPTKQLNPQSIKLTKTFRDHFLFIRFRIKK